MATKETERFAIRLTGNQLLGVATLFGGIFWFLSDIKSDINLLKDQVAEIKACYVRKPESSKKEEPKKLVQLGEWIKVDPEKFKEYGKY